MKREEILRKYRQEGVDEGREQVNRRGDDAGFWAMLLLSLLLMLYQAWRRLPFGDIPALLFCFCSVGAWSRYRAAREKGFLWMSIGTGLACLVCLIWYVARSMGWVHG